MIPEFPQFKKIELTNRKEVERFTSKFLPYADFNFSNMWAWDLEQEMGLSVLNGNLVVKFSDYLSGQPFLSFFGENRVNETTQELIAFSEKNYKTGILKLIPETVIGLLDKSEFDAILDIDSRDYIYSIPRLATIDAWPKSSLSKGVKQFIKKCPDYIVKQNSIKEMFKNEYLEMFKKWSESKNIENFSKLREYRAFERFFEIENENIKVVSLYKDNLLLGFDIYETCSDAYILSHFSKTDISFHKNINSILNWEEAKIFNAQKMLYFNWQQDLGIPELRKSKAKYKPDFFLNKFIIKKHK